MLTLPFFLLHVLLSSEPQDMSQYESSTAPILAGTQANWLLLGTLTLQLHTFHICFPNERWWIKLLAYGLYVLEVVQSAITSHFAYSLLVTGWGNPTVFTQLPWSSLATPIFTGITSCTVQIFFAWRIWTLRKKELWAWLAAGFIILLALAQSLAAIISDARFAVTTNIAELPKLLNGVKFWLIGSAVCDVFITIVMLFILTDYRRSAPWKSTDSIVTKLIYNTVETGAVTSVVAIIDVVLFIQYTNENYHQFPAFMLGKLYTTVLLASLNSRAELRKASSMPNTLGAEGEERATEIQWRRYSTAARSAFVSGAESELATGTSHKLAVHSVKHATDDEPVKSSRADSSTDVYELDTKRYDNSTPPV
ncbi:hypothetical protein MIND_00622800 [Mycena indigotica]|uniref:DUF6534 domain-containing protein n=1 Tax=Mycena indigotica TaxID=2126181 RepID=A0A8H6SRL2_9AGAR|nr:uncharacterized protein MIND_00622800 [Mycena indigotica]KAF7303923.1 hypothetical protein MIND_00622800 [Mycena indigotica]